MPRRFEIRGRYLLPQVRRELSRQHRELQFEKAIAQVAIETRTERQQLRVGFTWPRPCFAPISEPIFYGFDFRFEKRRRLFPQHAILDSVEGSSCVQIAFVSNSPFSPHAGQNGVDAVLLQRAIGFELFLQTAMKFFKFVDILPWQQLYPGEPSVFERVRLGKGSL